MKTSNKIMTVEDKNRILAKFMKINLTGQEERFNPLTDHASVEDMMFHNNWVWLIDLVKMVHATKDAEIELHSKNLVIITYASETKQYFANDLFKNTFDACFDFVQWYNQQTK